MSRPEEIRAKLREVESELAVLAQKALLTRGEQEHWDRSLRQQSKLEAEIATLDARRENYDRIRGLMASGETRELPGTPYGAYQAADVNHAQAGALRAVESNAASLSSDSLDRVDELVRSSGPADNSHFARWVEVHGRPEYSTAFGKIAASGDPAVASLQMSDLERGALADSFALRSERAQAEGSTGSGGYAIPVFIDPSVILTNQQSGNPFLQIARTVDVNTSAWKGVSSAGVSWSFDTEAAEVSDDSLTSITQPTVTVFMARGFIPYSIEVSEDWPGFQTEMARILSVGYDELLLDKFSRGTGTGEPNGILHSAANATPTTIVTSTTDGAFGQEDVYATWAALPQFARRNASWMMSVDVMDKIRQFGSATNWHAVTVQLPEGAVDRLMNRGVFESTYFPVFSSTTGASNRLVVGDFSNYVIARRTGMTVELVPQLLNTANNLPSGQRGWFAYARIGGSSVNDAAFRLQANT